MPVMVSRWQRFGSLGLRSRRGCRRAASGATSSESPAVSGASASPTKLLKIGGPPGKEPERTVDPLLMPYPYLSPTLPPSTRTVLDGTYLRVLTLRDVGGARIGLPFRCLRCPPSGSTPG